LRYFTKSYLYGTAPGAVSNPGQCSISPFNTGQNPNGAIPFKKVMAKIPTVTGYSNATGATNTVRDSSAAVDRAITAVASAGDSGFGGFALSTQNASATIYSFHYTADTGW
jgi:hypothetical protein